MTNKAVTEEMASQGFCRFSQALLQHLAPGRRGRRQAEAQEIQGGERGDARHHGEGDQGDDRASGRWAGSGGRRCAPGRSPRARAART